jgi:prepilin-type processing-associated H-X9-DG protein
MRVRISNKTRGQKVDAFTLIDAIIVICVAVLLFIMVGLLLPYFGKYHDVPRINCINNLKQVGLAFMVYVGDNNNRFPMQSLTNQAGGQLYTSSADAFRYFQVMSNELSSPATLICPEDKHRTKATNFTSDFNSSRISYFIDLDGNEMLKNSFVSGDDNITNGMQSKNGLLAITARQPAGWTMERHRGMGNIAMADGSVQQFTTIELQAAIQKTGFATNRLLMPVETSSK